MVTDAGGGRLRRGLEALPGPLGGALDTTDFERLRKESLRSIGAFHRMLGLAAGTLIEVEGAVGSLIPFAADAPFLTSIVPTSEKGLLTAAGEMSARAPDARPGVWLGAGLDRAATDLGLGRRAVVTLMGAFVADCDLSCASAERVSPAAVGVLNDLVYANRDGRLARILAALPSDRVHGYGRSGREARLVAGALAVQLGTDCSVEYVATHPQARRAGHASSVMRCLLRAAGAWGYETISLRASSEGSRLYAHLGFSDLGTVEVWQRPVRR
jgi:GNAT superfamily N-acetyltransferase